MPTDAKEAVKQAVDYVKFIFSEDGIREPRLEEIELTNDDRVWQVTVSFVRPANNPLAAAIGGGELAKMFPPPGKREDKVIQVDSHSGQVRAMKMRELPGDAGRS
jgi:hypothetical protein